MWHTRFLNVYNANFWKQEQGLKKISLFGARMYVTMIDDVLKKQYVSFPI